MTTNHKTTTLLVAMAAIAATLLAAGTVAALGSNHFAFAWHKEYKKSYGEDNKYGGDQGRDNYGRDQKRDGDQYLKCIVIGGGDERGDSGTTRASAAPGLEDNNGGGISDHSCNNYDSGTFTPSTGDGVIPRG
jgi:hypothetical protein